LIAHPQVGGVSVSLHDVYGGFPRYMLIIPTYKLIEMLQAIGRIFRAGTLSKAFCRIVYAKAFGGEPKILLALANKSDVLQKVTSSEDRTTYLRKLDNEIEGEINQVYLNEKEEERHIVSTGEIKLRILERCMETTDFDKYLIKPKIENDKILRKGKILMSF
jgi:hypothetical protein